MDHILGRKNPDACRPRSARPRARTSSPAARLSLLFLSGPHVFRSVAPFHQVPAAWGERTAGGTPSTTSRWRGPSTFELAAGRCQRAQREMASTLNHRGSSRTDAEPFTRTYSFGAPPLRAGHGSHSLLHAVIQ